MLLRLFKNDIKNGFLTNLMMTIFITISTMLACTSLSVIYSSQHQVSYFMDDMGNVADYNFTMMNVTTQDEQELHTFMDAKEISEYEMERDVVLPTDAIHFLGKEKLESTSCFATTLPKTYNFLFDEEGNIPNIESGSVGIPLSMKKRLDLTIGDRLEIELNGRVFHYQISCFVADSLYGSDMMGRNRFILSDADFKELYHGVDTSSHALVLSVMEGKHTKNLEYEMQQANLVNALLISKDTARLSFMGVSMGTSAILFMCGIILLCMSFLIIRFTILFQIENNYAEIGIMKAIGFTHRQIKPLYLLKYMGIAGIATILGFVCSIPLALTLQQMQAGVVPLMPQSIGTLLSSLIVFVILVMVYTVTVVVLRKLKKQSAMDAIRKGNEGETFQEHTRFTLAKTRLHNLSHFLAMNDLMAQKKQFIVMVVIYALCMVMILVPLTLKDTFQKDAFLQILKITKGDLYTLGDGGSVEEMEQQRKQLEKDLKQYDKDVRVTMETMTSAALSDDGLNTSVYLMKRANGNTISCDVGKAPTLANEIALSTTMAKRYGKSVGDSITLRYEGNQQVYLITGIYSSIMNLGYTTLAGDIDYTYAYTGYLIVHLSSDEKSNLELANKIVKEYQKIRLVDGTQMMKSFSGDVPNQIVMMYKMVLVLILVILFALTILFSKLHMLRNKKTLALMRSLGYTKRKIRHWLMVRCMMQSILALCLGILLHSFVANRLLETYMESMGMGSVALRSAPYNMFVVYPLLYLAVIALAQVLVNRTLPAWDIKDMSEE